MPSKVVAAALSLCAATALTLAATPAGPAVAAVAAGSAVPVTPLSGPVRFASTDGDILAVTRVKGFPSPAVAIGGDFDTVITPDGVRHRARNLAVLDAVTGSVLVAGDVNGYVRALTSYDGVLYLGGDFTSVSGRSRARAAALTSSGKVTGWAPSPGARVRALRADRSGVYLAGDFAAVRKVSRTTGVTVWSRRTAAGSVRALLWRSAGLYVGGLFERYDGVTRHGLVKVSKKTGVLDPAFDARLRADSGFGDHGNYDGEGILALSTAPTTGDLLLGVGGKAPFGLSSNEVLSVSGSTGERHWRQSPVGDVQAVATVGGTAVAGYHRNGSNQGVDWPTFAGQLDGVTGTLTGWDPQLTGNQANADGGNNGVQAMHADGTLRRLYVAGAFTHQAGRTGYQSLAVFTW